jgi:hypothetical protein
MSQYEGRTGNGSSEKNVTDAVENAVVDAMRGEEIDGIKFDVTIWVETKHHSPWHITYNAVVRERGGS